MSEEVLICDWCSREFKRPARKGPRPRFCSPAHRQAAHQAGRRKLAAGMKEAMASTHIVTALASSMPKFDTGVAAALASSMPKFDTGIVAAIADMVAIPKFDTGVAAALASSMPEFDTGVAAALASSMPKFDTGVAAALASSMPKFDTGVAAALASSMPKFDTGIVAAIANMVAIPKFDTGVAAALASSMPEFDTGIAAAIAGLAAVPKFDTGIVAAIADMVAMPRIDPALMTVLEHMASMPSTLAQLEQLQTTTGISEDLERLVNADDEQGLDRNSSTPSARTALLLLVLLAVVLQLLGDSSIGDVEDIARTASQSFLLLDGIYQSLYARVAAVRAVIDLLAVIGGIQFLSTLLTGGSRSESDDEGTL